MLRIIVSSILFAVTPALKLQQSPEFDMEGSIYDEECGDRYNYKCWKKGGHSLDKEEAAYATGLLWADAFACTANGFTDTGVDLTGTCNPSVVATFNKGVDASLCTGVADGATTPHLLVTGGIAEMSLPCTGGNVADKTKLTFTLANQQANVESTLTLICHDRGTETKACTDITNDLATCQNQDGNDDVEGGGAKIKCVWRTATDASILVVPRDAIQVSPTATIKNAGKSKNAIVTTTENEGCFVGNQRCNAVTATEGADV